MTTTTLHLQQSKATVIAYWTVTILLTAGMLAGGIGQLLHAKFNADGVVHLGFPLYVLSILGAWKVAGAIVLLAPRLTLLKEWAYAGFFFLMTGAVVAHLASGDGIGGVVYQLIFVILIVLSWYLRPASRRIVA